MIRRGRARITTVPGEGGMGGAWATEEPESRRYPERGEVMGGVGDEIIDGIGNAPEWGRKEVRWPGVGDTLRRPARSEMMRGGVGWRSWFQGVCLLVVRPNQNPDRWAGPSEPCARRGF